jgi:1-acyl-sn-glycerol-3-phosphate acyltransferase
MWSFDAFQIASQVVSGVIKSKDEDPFKARVNAKNTTRNFYENICPNYWINVEYKFSKNSIKNNPEIIESIKKYISLWEKSDNLPLLWLWNHQAFWLEAVWAYDYFPTDWRIVLKDDLIKPPFFWDSIKSLAPIIHYRNYKNLERIRHNEIKNQILENKAILIFPEWTRSKTWELWNLKSSLYKPAFETIKLNIKEFSQKIAIITSDTFSVLPNTLENSLLFMWELNPWNIIYTIDIIDISLYENIRKFNLDIRKIILNNLK